MLDDRCRDVVYVCSLPEARVLLMRAALWRTRMMERAIGLSFIVLFAIGCGDSRRDPADDDFCLPPTCVGGGDDDDECAPGEICLEDDAGGTPLYNDPYARCSESAQCSPANGGDCYTIDGLGICTNLCFEDAECPT